MTKERKKKRCRFCGAGVKKVLEIPIKDVEKRRGFIGVTLYNCGCRDQMRDERELDLRKSKIQDLFKNSRIDEKFLENDYKVYRNELLPYIEEFDWVERGDQLLIYGTPGNHKTGQVTAMLKKAMIDKQYSVRYYRATEIPYQKDYQKIKACDVLVLDNFGRDSFETSRGALFDIVDYRMHNFKTTILIINGDFEDVQRIYSLPMMSRLNEFIWIGPIGKDGEDKRGQKFEDPFPIDNEK